ncbi:MAG: CHASE2 domain-containing protein, partial [Nitrospirae bacterium]|nr:CHASE2 domain-containing protein [Nitrospirota bacterium]
MLQWSIDFRRHLYIGLISGIVTFLFSLLPVAELLELKGYDLFYLIKKHGHPPDDIVIVAIDEPSFAELEKQWPWPRGLHARLIDTLKKEGASVIGLDIIFSEPSQIEEDRALSDAIKRAGNVVLASDIEMIKDKRYTQEMVIEPISILKEGAFIGFVTIPVDRDNVVRRFYPLKEGERLFAEEITHLYSKKIYQVPEGAYISYSGPQRGFNTISYYQALKPSVFLPQNFFRGKIVLVGKSIKTTPEPGRPGPDLFATPYLFSSKEGGLMNGVEIQANMVNNHLRGKFVMRFSRFG